MFRGRAASRQFDNEAGTRFETKTTCTKGHMYSVSGRACVRVCVTKMIAQTIHKKQLENIDDRESPMKIRPSIRSFIHPFWQMALVLLFVLLSRASFQGRRSATISFLHIETSEHCMLLWFSESTTVRSIFFFFFFLRRF